MEKTDMTKGTMARLVVLTMLAAVSTICGATWPNQPAGSTLLSDFDFSAKTGSGWTKVYDGGAIVNDPTAPVSPPGVLQYTWNHSAGYGDVSNTNFFFPGGADNYYIGFWWKPSNPFTGWQTSQNKINLIRNEPDGHIYLLMSGPQAGNAYVLNFTTTWRSYSGVSNSHLAGGGTWCDAAGICNVFPNAGSGTVTLGAWQLLEYYIQRSTTVTSRNGILRWWLNGKLAGNYTNINTPRSLFSEVQFAPVWDAMETRYPNAVDRHWFDHVHVAKTNGNPPITSLVRDGNKLSAEMLTVNSSRLTAEPGFASVRFQMTQKGTHSLSVFDLSGREVWKHSGSGEAVWNHGGNLKKGVYLVRVEQNGKTSNTNYCHVW